MRRGIARRKPVLADSTGRGRCVSIPTVIDRSRAKHLVPLAAVHLVGLACGLIGVRWTSAVVPPEVLGLFGALINTTLVGATVTHQGLIVHIQRTWTAETPRRRLWRVLREFGWTPVLLLGVVVAAVYLALNLNPRMCFGAAWLGWMLALNALVALTAAAQAALQAGQAYWRNFQVSAAGSMARSFLPPLAAMTMGATLAVVGSAYLLHAAIVAGLACLAVPTLARRPDTGDSAAPSDGHRRLTWLMIGVGCASWVAGFTPRWCAVGLLDSVEAGCFMLAMNLAGIVPSAASLIGLNYSFPVVYAAGRRGDEAAAMRRRTERTVLVVLAAAQGGLLAVDWIVPHLVGPLIHARYAASADWLLPAGGAVLATVSGPFFHNLLLARTREWSCLWLALISAVFRIAAIGLATLAVGSRGFALSLIALPWLTLALEAGLARRLLLPRAE